jgi:hypothetical protein
MISSMLGAKYKTKGELERLIRHDMDVYLCAAKHVNVFYYRDIFNGTR